MAGPKKQPKVCDETLRRLKDVAERIKEDGKISKQDLEALRETARKDKAFHPTGREVVE